MLKTLFTMLMKKVRIKLQAMKVAYWLQLREIELAEQCRAAERIAAVDLALTHASVKLSTLKLAR